MLGNKMVLKSYDYIGNIPIAILFGPPNCGKTYLLWRLLHWLKMRGFYITVDPILFHYGYYYETIEILSNWSNFSHNLEKFHWPILLDIISKTNGSTVAKIYYQPGHLSYDDTIYSRYNIFPQIFDYIAQLNNPKKWIIFTELDCETLQYKDKEIYSMIIQDLKTRYFSNRDNVICLCSKIDKNYSYFEKGRLLSRKVFHHLEEEYSTLVNTFKYTGLSKLLFGKYYFKTVCFTAGIFDRTYDDRILYTPSPDWYCSDLWNVIQKAIR